MTEQPMRLAGRLARMLGWSVQDAAALGGTVATSAGPIHYLLDGSAEAFRSRPPLVLLHGASGNLRDWATSLQPRLARSHATIAFDRPGFGLSQPSRGPIWTLEAQVEALREALRTMGQRRYILVGHSYSGALALDWALRHPGEVAGICVLSGATMDWGGALSGYYRFTSLPLIGRAVSRLAPVIASERLIEQSLATIFRPQPVPAHYRQMAGIEMALRPQTFRINARAMHTLHRTIVVNQPRYPEIACPVEIVHGAEDRLVPPEIHAGPLSDCLPDAVLSLLPGIGHMPHHGAPDQVAAALSRLMARIGGDAPALFAEPDAAG